MSATTPIEFIEFPNFGFLKVRLPNELFLNLIKESEKFNINTEVKTALSAGLGIPKHMEIKDNFDELSEFVFKTANEYNQYYDYMSTIKVSSKNLKLKTQSPWFNYQKKHDFLPNHHHDGILSYSGWIKIPYDLSNEQKNNSDNRATASVFEFSYNASNGTQMGQLLPIDKTWEGYMIMFPSNLRHCVYPFYTSDETRISFAGNILLDSSGATYD